MTTFIVICVCLLALLDLVIWILYPDLKSMYGKLYVLPFMSIVCLIDYKIDNYRQIYRKGKGK